MKMENNSAEYGERKGKNKVRDPSYLCPKRKKQKKIYSGAVTTLRNVSINILFFSGQPPVTPTGSCKSQKN